jgi:acyl-coenzyme A thioesterase PaaI-like protein
MPETPEETAARVQASFERQAMMATLGVDLSGVAAGRVELVVKHDDRFTQQHGFMHAGAVAAVLDSACGYAAFTVMPPDAAVLTATYTINLLAPGGRWWCAAVRRWPTERRRHSRSCRRR